MSRRLVHIQTAGFATPNGRAFLMPLLLHRQLLLDAGIELKLFSAEYAKDDLPDCDYLIVDSKALSPRWAKGKDQILSEMQKNRSKAGALIFCDISDSASWDHAHILPFVDLYCKSQLLVDRSLYLQPLYGHRYYADYYHRFFGINDDQHESSEPVSNPDDLKKLCVGWNSGLADYSLFGPLRMALYEKAPFKTLLRFPWNCKAPSVGRRMNASLRMGTNYSRRSVAFHRRYLAEMLGSRLQTGKLSRRAYFRELSRSKLVVSPFGLGEITLRDFEVFLAGAMLVKPDMSHMETWPNFYMPGETFLSYKLDFSDFEVVLETALSDEHRLLEVARAGQSRYLTYVSGPEAGLLFVDHFKAILDRCILRKGHD
ncbi:glycosyltransferase [Thalassospira lucentensis]|uniref:glycosyltransferase n=1 Tax=Thalassospira lucentensis TaxID=168935 RepID=UPI003D2E9E1E